MKFTELSRDFVLYHHLSMHLTRSSLTRFPSRTVWLAALRGDNDFLNLPRPATLSRTSSNITISDGFSYELYTNIRKLTEIKNRS